MAVRTVPLLGRLELPALLYVESRTPSIAAAACGGMVGVKLDSGTLYRPALRPEGELKVYVAPAERTAS